MKRVSEAVLKALAAEKQVSTARRMAATGFQLEARHRFAFLLLCASACQKEAVRESGRAAPGDWAVYGGNSLAQRYSPPDSNRP